ncbi:hypothetical protein Hanom_Chr04g00332111 [Helianthus anomalus]
MYLLVNFPMIFPKLFSSKLQIIPTITIPKTINIKLIIICYKICIPKIPFCMQIICKLSHIC